MTQSVGVIGAGRMGMPIVGHLARVGFEVFATDLDVRKREEVERRGAHFAVDAADVARQSGIILVAVGYDREVRELVLGTSGLLARVQPGAIIAVLSTISPKTVELLAGSAEAAGAHLVDSTVCRGGTAADEGTLLSFVAGDQAVVERLRPVLRAYSSDVVHTGKVGTAQVAKAVNNLILWANLVADHEGLALAQRYGVNVEALRKALMISSATNGALDNWGNQTMAWADDDMEIVVEMAAHVGVSLPQVGLNREICRTLKPRRYQLDRYGM